MIEIKIAGRGGQGAVLASQLLAQGLFDKGLAVQSFPSFGAERRGAPVAAFVRVDEREITRRCAVRQPDWLIVMDPSLIANPMVMAGADESTTLLINTLEAPAGSPSGGRIYTVDATSIAARVGLATASFPIVNTAMVGAFAAASGLLDIDAITRVVSGTVPIKKEKNAAAAREAFDLVGEVKS